MLRTHFAHVFKPPAISKNKTIKNEFESRPFAKYSVWGDTVFNALQNRNEKLKMANRSAEFRFGVCDYDRLRNVLAKSVIIVQTYEVKCAKGRSS